MTTKHFLTVSALVPLPWHNLNRDDRGLPKSLREGGLQRGMLSPQSLKRAARMRFEEGIDHPSVRSTTLAKAACDRARELAAERGVAFNDAAAEKEAKRVIAQLTSRESKTDAKDTITWLSGEEFGSLVDSLATSGGSTAELTVSDHRTTASLAIAAFGRMMAANQHANVDAAVAVGPAVTTHGIAIDIDYFTAVDDVKRSAQESAGSGHLGQAYYTSGVYFRSFTIDRAQLRRNWTGWDAPEAEARLRSFVESVLIALPSGKQTSTAAKSLPAFVLAEEQAHRFTYQFQKPVQADADGGFLKGSVERLIEEAAAAREFDAKSVGATMIAGASESLPQVPFDAATGDLDALVRFIVDWIQDA